MPVHTHTTMASSSPHHTDIQANRQQNPANHNPWASQHPIASPSSFTQQTQRSFAQQYSNMFEASQHSSSIGAPAAVSANLPTQQPFRHRATGSGGTRSIVSNGPLSVLSSGVYYPEAGAGRSAPQAAQLRGHQLQSHPAPVAWYTAPPGPTRPPGNVPFQTMQSHPSVPPPAASPAHFQAHPRPVQHAGSVHSYHSSNHPIRPLNGAYGGFSALSSEPAMQQPVAAPASSFPTLQGAAQTLRPPPVQQAPHIAATQQQLHQQQHMQQMHQKRASPGHSSQKAVSVHSSTAMMKVLYDQPPSQQLVEPEAQVVLPCTAAVQLPRALQPPPASASLVPPVAKTEHARPQSGPQESRPLHQAAVPVAPVHSDALAAGSNVTSPAVSAAALAPTYVAETQSGAPVHAASSSVASSSGMRTQQGGVSQAGDAPNHPLGSLASFATPGGAQGQAWRVSAVKRQADLDDSTVASSETGSSTAAHSRRIPSILRQIGASHLPMIHGCFGLPLDEQCRHTQAAVVAPDNLQQLMARFSALCSPPTVRVFCNDAHLALDKNWRHPELITPRLNSQQWRSRDFLPGSFVHPNLAHNELLATDAGLEMVSRIIMHRASRLHQAWAAEDAARAETAALLGMPVPATSPERTLQAAVHVMLCRVVGAMQKGLRSWPTDLQRFSPCHLLLQEGKPRDAGAQFMALAIEVPVRLHWANSTLVAPLPAAGSSGAIPFPCLQAVTFGMSRLNKGGPEVPTPLPTFLDIFDETDHSVPDYTTSSLDPMLRILAMRFAPVFGSSGLTMELNRQPSVPPSMKEDMLHAIAGREMSSGDGTPRALSTGEGAASPGETASSLGPSVSQVGVTYVAHDAGAGNMARSAKDPTDSQLACSDHGAPSALEADEQDAIVHDSASAVSVVQPLLERAGVNYMKFPPPGTAVTLTPQLRRRAAPVWMRASALLPAERICTHIPHLLPVGKKAGVDAVNPGTADAVQGGVKRPREDSHADGPNKARATSAKSTPSSSVASSAQEEAAATAYSELELSCVPANFLFGRIVLTLALMDAVQVLA